MVYVIWSKAQTTVASEFKNNRYLKKKIKNDTILHLQLGFRKLNSRKLKTSQNVSNGTT